MFEQFGIDFDYVVVGWVSRLHGCSAPERRPDARVASIEAGRENRYEQSCYSTGVHTMFEIEANWAFKTMRHHSRAGHKRAVHQFWPRQFRELRCLVVIMQCVPVLVCS